MMSDCPVSHGNAKRQIRQMGEKMRTKTGRLIHACPTQTAALAEIDVITGN
jgi:hypothetical protein